MPIINEAEVQAKAAGQKTSTIENAINEIPGVEEVEVDMSPFYVSVAPKKQSKIIVIQEQIPMEPEANADGQQTEETNDQNP